MKSSSPDFLFLFLTSLPLPREHHTALTTQLHTSLDGPHLPWVSFSKSFRLSNSFAIPYKLKNQLIDIYKSIVLGFSGTKP